MLSLVSRPRAQSGVTRGILAQVRWAKGTKLDEATLRTILLPLGEGVALLCYKPQKRRALLCFTAAAHATRWADKPRVLQAFVVVSVFGAAAFSEQIADPGHTLKFADPLAHAPRRLLICLHGVLRTKMCHGTDLFFSLLGTFTHSTHTHDFGFNVRVPSPPPAPAPALGAYAVPSGIRWLIYVWIHEVPSDRKGASLCVEA